MAVRVNPTFIDDLVRYGAEDVQLCYQCGDCSTVCPHADDVYKFPRKSMRLLQMGLEQKLETTLEPWLCYYCGQCSEQCPREADPGETMMSLRRWLISRYDFTGIARRFFSSRTTEIIAIIVVALLTGGFLLYYGFSGGSIKIYDGEGAFLPSSFIHRFDLTVGSILLVFLLINASRMWYFVMIRGTAFPVPWWLYIKQFYQLPWHFFTQKRYAECEKKHEHPVFMPWLLHLGLMLGYVTMLVLVMAFVEKLQAGPEIVWLFLSSDTWHYRMIAGTVYFIRNRIRKNYVQYKKSHGTRLGFCGFVIIYRPYRYFTDIFHRTGLRKCKLYICCTSVSVVPWLLRCLFSKWAHLIYVLSLCFLPNPQEALRVRKYQFSLSRF
jgi:ferredoxin